MPSVLPCAADHEDTQACPGERMPIGNWIHLPLVLCSLHQASVEGHAMSTEQCWSLAPDGSRCRQSARPGGCFCEHHSRGELHPGSIWRAPVEQMPPELVARIRAYYPEVAFPAALTPLSSSAPPLSAAPSPPPAAPNGAAYGQVPGRVGEADLPVLAALPSAMLSTPPAEEQTDPMEWLQGLLRGVMQAVTEGEGTPLQKASAVARLGALFLRTARVHELARARKQAEAANRELADRVEELLERLRALEAENVELQARAALVELLEAPPVRAAADDTSGALAELVLTAPEGVVSAPSTTESSSLPAGSRAATVHPLAANPPSDEHWNRDGPPPEARQRAA